MPVVVSIAEFVANPLLQELLEILNYVSLDTIIEIEIFPDGGAIEIETLTDGGARREITFEHFLEFNRNSPTLAIATFNAHHEQRMHNVHLRFLHLSGRIMSWLWLPRTNEGFASIAYSPTDSSIATFLSNFFFDRSA